MIQTQEEIIEIPISIALSETGNFNISFVDETEFQTDIDTIIVRDVSPAYEGEYIVTPRAFEQQVLETKDKRMLDDVTVLEIPYNEVTNPTGGLTVSIG